MERATVDVYERRAADWLARRPPRRVDAARDFAARVSPGEVRVDAGSGPGSYTARLGAPVVALDAALAMVRLAASQAPGAWPVQGDLEALPFRRGTLAGAWARASYLHVERERLPLALAELHHALRVGAPVDLTMKRGDYEGWELPGDDFPGRFFACWAPPDLADVVVGAGFVIDDFEADSEWIVVNGRRARTLPDTVGPRMRLLLCGLNPSLCAADAGVGFARPGNRFWPAALAAGLVTRDRDPLHALRVHGVGMTDLVKRATVGAAELAPAEFRQGLLRVWRLVARHRPGAVCFVGLTGWRAAVDRRAKAGLQPNRIGDVPVYVMPNTSGLNARVRVDELADHLRAAAALGGMATPPELEPLPGVEPENRPN
jgi:double-stranded uracil-DNA glycosylase